MRNGFDEDVDDDMEADDEFDSSRELSFEYILSRRIGLIGQTLLKDELNVVVKSSLRPFRRARFFVGEDNTVPMFSLSSLEELNILLLLSSMTAAKEVEEEDEELKVSLKNCRTIENIKSDNCTFRRVRMVGKKEGALSTRTHTKNLLLCLIILARNFLMSSSLFPPRTRARTTIIHENAPGKKNQ